jgi:hypothetical protein
VTNIDGLFGRTWGLFFRPAKETSATRQAREREAHLEAERETGALLEEQGWPASTDPQRWYGLREDGSPSTMMNRR